ncbi:MAG: YraN family protein [Anaerolineae bacterium]|nr:YraN family protein [Anaerolineae bacterium]
MANQQQLGEQGEMLAANYLEQKGYRILARNWNCRYGEIDLVAQDGETLVFVEVKTRHASTTEKAFASITPTKQERLAATAQLYLSQELNDDTDWRMDVIAIALPRKGKPIIEHVEDALGW